MASNDSNLMSNCSTHSLDESTIVSNDVKEMDEIIENYKSNKCFNDLKIIKEFLINSKKNITENSELKQSIDYILQKCCLLAINDQTIRQTLDSMIAFISINQITDIFKIDGKTIEELITKSIQTIIEDIFSETELNSESLQKRRELVLRHLAKESDIYGKHFFIIIIKNLVEIIKNFIKRNEEKTNSGSIGDNESENFYLILSILDLVLKDLSENIENNVITKEDFNYLRPKLNQFIRAIDVNTILMNSNPFPIHCFCIESVKQKMTKIKDFNK